MILLSSLQCRFYFPRNPQPIPSVGKDMNPKHWSFLAARDDQRLNQYSPALMIGWKVNLDAAPCTDVYAVKEYILKYCGKPEVKSKSFGDLCKERTALYQLITLRPLLSLSSVEQASRRERLVSKDRNQYGLLKSSSNKTRTMNGSILN